MNDFLDENIDNFFGSASAPQTPQTLQTPQQVPQQMPQTQMQRAVGGALSASPFSDISLNLSIQGVTVADVGTMVSHFPIDRIKFTPEKVERFSIMIDKVLTVPYHFIDGIGSVICNGGRCCQTGTKRNLRYVFYAVSYGSVDTYGRITGPDVELKALALAESQYFQLVQIQNVKGMLSSFDIVGSAKKKSDGQKQFTEVTFTEAGPATWLTNQNAVAQISEKFKKDGKYVLDSFARSMTDEELAEAIRNAEERRMNNPQQNGGGVSLNQLR